MLYFDNSFLVPLFLVEATSDKVAELVADSLHHECAVSDWTRVEFASMLAREVRLKALTANVAETLVRKFDEMVSGSFSIHSPTAPDFSLARSYILNFATGLRSGDALHLAIAANRKATAIYSFDKGLLKAGKQLGLPVSAGIRLAGYPR
jgi:predicted nucleic acid-binding protein